MIKIDKQIIQSHVTSANRRPSLYGNPDLNFRHSNLANVIYESFLTFNFPNMDEYRNKIHCMCYANINLSAEHTEIIEFSMSVY